MTRLLNFLLIVELLFTFTKSVIKLPLNRVPFHASKDRIISSFLANTFSTEINVGTPPQKLSVIIRQSEVCTFIANSDSKDNPVKFIEKNSSTYKPDQSELYDKYLSDLISTGIRSNDTLKVGKVKIEDFCFVSTGNSTITGSSGVIGLGIGYSFLKKTMNLNLIHQLKKKDILSSYAYTIKIKSKDKGEVLIGDYPHKYDSSFNEEDLIMTKAIRSNQVLEWGFQLDRISYNNKNISGVFEEKAKVMIEVNYIIGSSALMEEVKNDFFGNLIERKKCEVVVQERKQWFICEKDIDKKKFKEINFYNKDLNITFTLDFNDVFENFGSKTYFKICFFENEKEEKNLYWVFGEPFLRKYQMIFDQDKKMNGFYKKVNAKIKIKFETIIIFVLIVFCFCLVFIIIKKFKESRKKRAIELIEDYEYITK